MARSPKGSIVFIIRGSHGYIDECRYKTVAALAPSRRCVWKTEAGARTAFANIERRFPQFGPEYTLERAEIGDHSIPQPVEILDTKKIG